MRYRVAVAADAQLYFNWANDPDTRRQSFNSAPISLEVHEVWFARKVVDPNALLLVFETEERQAVGQVRFEEQVNGEVIIGVSVDKAFRGHGLASQIIQQGCEVYKHLRNNVPISAYIKPNNEASIRAFERAGFVETSQSGALNESISLLLKS